MNRFRSNESPSLQSHFAIELHSQLEFPVTHYQYQRNIDVASAYKVIVGFPYCNRDGSVVDRRVCHLELHWTAPRARCIEITVHVEIPV